MRGRVKSSPPSISVSKPHPEHCPSQTRFAARTRFDGHGPPQGDSLSPPAQAAEKDRVP